LDGATLRRHLDRAFRCDFTRFGAADDERAALAAAPEPVTDATAQDYLAWRRSMAWVALGPVALAAVLAFVGWAGTWGQEGIPASVHLLQALYVGSYVWLLAAVVSAVVRWREAALVRRRLRIGWLVSFLAPIVLCLVPFVDLVLAGREVPSQVETVEDLKVWLGVGFARLEIGIKVLLMLAPPFLALFPGIARAGLTVKTLLPGRSLPAAVSGLMAPVYAAAFLVAGTVVQQLGGSMLLAVGLVTFLFGPLLLSRRAFGMVEPTTREELGPRVRDARRKAGILVGIGGLLALIGVFQVEIFGKHLLAFSGQPFVGPLELLEKVVLYVGSLSVLTVVAADALLEGMVETERRARRHAETEAFARDGERLGEVARILRPAAVAAPPPQA
jgi:hypothetical protein